MRQVKIICLMLALTTVLIMGTGLQSAHAVFEMTVDSVVIQDNGTGDFRSEVGVIGYTSSIGTVVGSSIGSLTYPELNLSPVISATGSFDIWLTLTDIGPSSGVVETTASFNGASAASFTSYVDLSNSLYGTSTTTGSITGLTGNDTSSPLTLTSPYSMTAKASITNTSGIASGALNVQVVPEPISSTLFIIGGAVMGGRLYRRRKRA